MTNIIDDIELNNATSSGDWTSGAFDQPEYIQSPFNPRFEENTEDMMKRYKEHWDEQERLRKQHKNFCTRLFE